MDSAVVFLSLAAPFDFTLNHLEYVRVNDGLMVSLDIVLRNLTLVDFCFLGQEVNRIGLLQQGITLVLLVPQYSEFDTKPQGVAFRGCRGCIQGVAFSAGGCIRGLHFCQGVAFRGCISPRGLHLGIKMPSRSLAHGEQGTCWAVTMYGEIVDL